MLRQKYQLKNYSWILVALVIILSSLGVLFINSADSSYTKKQFLGLVFCLVVMVAVSLINYNYICDFNRILYAINILMLAFVKVAGYTVGGAKRWINLGFTRLQPSEFSKIIMIIFVANYIQEHEEDFDQPKVILKLVGLCAVPLFLIVIEPDLSTTIDICLVLLAIIFIGGLNSKVIKKCFLIGIPVFVLFIFYIQTPNQHLLKEYQVNRIMSFINPSKYADSTAYQQNNSVMAIGSGQLMGKGINNNTISDAVNVTDTGLVSEQQTDFIFSVVGEETGFIGSVGIVLIYFAIVICCLIIASRARNISGRLIATGVGALIGFQSFINIGVATQFLPNTGLPLPFMSYGLTSLLSMMVGIGLVLNVGLQRSY